MKDYKLFSQKPVVIVKEADALIIINTYDRKLLANAKILMNFNDMRLTLITLYLS